MTWYLWLTIGFAVGSLWGSLQTMRLRNRRARQAVPRLRPCRCRYCVVSTEVCR